MVYHGEKLNQLVLAIPGILVLRIGVLNKTTGSKLSKQHVLFVKVQVYKLDLINILYTS
jgi:hypothetical protein